MMKASRFVAKLTTDGHGIPKMTSSENSSDRAEYRESRILPKWSPSAGKRRLPILILDTQLEFCKIVPAPGYCADVSASVRERGPEASRVSVPAAAMGRSGHATGQETAD